MKNVLSPKLVSFANRVAKFPFAKKVLKPLYYPYKRLLEIRRNKAYKKYALFTLTEFDKCMKSLGVPYTLIFGSMLGAVREKGFIKHDMDIDVAVWKEDYSRAIQDILEAKGFKLDHRFLIDDGESAREETYVMKGVSIDIFCIYPPIDDYPYICSKWMPVGNTVTRRDSMKQYGYLTGKRLEMPIKKEMTLMEFESLKLPVSINAKEVLEFYYGADYMSPNPKWTEEKDYPYRKEWPEKKAQYFEY